ncbi:MAG TPA: MATE family efflux transporter, partial [Myxococcales bacterium]|nr:MATE family efflux transporter [Myxococcales bacterium]
MNELRKLLRLAAPIAFTQAGYALMGLIDTAVVGRLGAGPLGAVGLANGLFFALAVIGLGAMLGLDPLFAQALGARDDA